MYADQATTTISRAETAYNRAASFIDALSALDSSMSLGAVRVLLFVAKNQDRQGGVTTSDLKDELGLSSAAASRYSYYWSYGHADPTHATSAMMDMVIDTKDRRKRLLRLTDKGELFLRSVRRDLLD